ncbi:hypothetical protein [uncultured Campylobacter sp.]|nr:hypothetical protein [uncultured Campylobacter sp.]
MQNNLRGCILNFKPDKMGKNIARLDKVVLKFNRTQSSPSSCLAFAAF